MKRPSQKATQLMAVKVGDDSYVAVLRFGPTDKNSSEVRLSLENVYRLAETNGLSATPVSRMTKGTTDILLFAGPLRVQMTEQESDLFQSDTRRIATSHTT